MTRRARRVAGGIGEIIDLDREWRPDYEAASRTDSMEMKLGSAGDERKECGPR